MQYLEAEKAIATTYYKDLFKRLSKKYGDLEETSRKIKVVRRVSEFATTVEEKTLLELVVEGHLDHVKSNIFLRLVYDLWGGVQRYITEKALDLLLDIVDWNNLVDLDGNDLITIGEVFDDKTIKSAVCEIMADKAVDYCLTTSAGIGRIIGEVLIQKYSMFDGDLLDDYAFAYNDPQKLKEDLRYIMDLEEKLTSIPENERIAIERDLTMFFLDQDVFRVGINNIVEFLKTHLLERMDPDDDAPRSPSPEIRQDPLILDLNRDGKVSTTAGKRYFDLDANGVAERVSWAASGDGFLALDRDGDGKFEDHELSTLEEAGIESIDLRYSDHRTEDENGNQIVRTGRFTWKDGDRGKVSEFLLERDTIHSLVGEQLEEPDKVAALPDLPQRGFLYSLHQAMVRDGSGELRKLTERFAGEKDSVARRSLLERMLLKWSEVSNVETTPNGGWLGFLEKFYGARYDWSSLTERGRRQLESAYESVSLYLYGNLLRQSHYADELEMLDYHLDGKGGFFLNTGRALESIVKENVSNPEQTKRSIAEFFLFLKTAGLYEYVDESEVESHAAVLSTYGSELPDVCRASYLAMKEPVGTYTLPYFVSGRGGTLDGDIHSNVLVGSEEADILRGGHGSDVLMGGRGSDTLVGGEDGDTYVWNLGDGDDRIVNSSTGSGEEDVLRLGKGDDTLKLCA